MLRLLVCCSCCSALTQALQLQNFPFGNVVLLLALRHCVLVLPKAQHVAIERSSVQQTFNHPDSLWGEVPEICNTGSAATEV